MGRPKLRYELGKPGLRNGICNSNAEAPPVAAGEFHRRALPLLCRCEESSRLVQQGLSRACEAGPPRCSVEPLNANFALEISNCAGERRLLNTERMCGPRIVQVVGYGQKVANLAKFHG
jgi:hypothetical protein